MGLCLDKHNYHEIAHRKTNLTEVEEYNISKYKSDNDVSSKALNPLPGFSFEYVSKYTVTDAECCICFIEYTEGMILHMLPCEHILHRSCLWEWYQKTSSCPICRRKYMS